MEKKLRELFKFLTENREFNKKLQEKYYRTILLPYSDTNSKILSLLYHTINTQSRPKIDKVAAFFKLLQLDLDCLLSFNSFVERVSNQKISSFGNLYLGMVNQPGWGEKTAALLTKSIYHIHNGQYNKKLKIWEDVPMKISKNDTIYLPVDRVIIAIFKKMDTNVNWDFKKINQLLQSKFTSQEMEVWDDLWFWGFISQNGTGEERQMIWNENKYWALKESEKDKLSIAKIKSRAIKFLKILNKL